MKFLTACASLDWDKLRWLCCVGQHLNFSLVGLCRQGPVTLCPHSDPEKLYHNRPMLFQGLVCSDVLLSNTKLSWAWCKCL